MKTKSLLAPATVALAALSLLASGCSRSEPPAPAWQPPRPVRIDAPGVWLNCFQSWPLCAISDDNVGPAGVLVRDGDWLSFVNDENMLYIYHASDGPVVKPTWEKGLLRVAGRVVGVMIEKESSACDWLERATPSELTGVRVLALHAELDATILPSFRKLAAVNPHVTVSTDTIGNLRLALQEFRPKAYAVDSNSWDDSMIEIVATQKQVETLLFNGRATAGLGVLQSLPNLRRLLISEGKVDQTGPLPPGLVNLKSLHVWGSDMAELSSLGPLPPGLEELTIARSKPLRDIGALSALTSLKALHLTGCENVNDLSALAGLRQLQWVSLPSGITQEQFAAFVAAHRNLTILEIVDCNQVTDLTPLRDLPGLESLILTGSGNDGSPALASPQNLAVLRSLKSLRYLGVHPGSGKEVSPEFAALRKALPDALVVPVAPFCLGSGWILLLLPVVALAAWCGARRARG